jgi:hypothetical protein
MVMRQIERECVLCGVRAEREERVFVIEKRDKKSKETVQLQAYNTT